MKPTELKKPLVPDVQLLTIRFSPCGKFLAAAACDASVRRWDVSGAEPVELPKITGFNGWVNSLAFHPDKTRLFACDSWGALVCWDHTAKEPKRVWENLTSHDGWTRKLALGPDGARLATVGKDGFARIWNPADGKKISEIPAKEDLLSMAWHPDGKHLVTGDLRGVITAWDVATGKPVRTFDANEMYRYDRIQDVGGVRCFAFLNGGKTLVAGGAKPATGGFVQAFPLLFAFEWDTAKRIGTWQGATNTEGYVLDLRNHPDGVSVIGAASGQPGNGKLFFWKPADAKPEFEIAKPNCHSVDIHPDGKRIALATTLGSNLNGKPKDKEYTGSHSPIVFWTLPG